MGMPETALDLMADVIQRQPKPKTGSLFLIAHANLSLSDYDAVIAVVDKITSLNENKTTVIQALNLKREAYSQNADSEKMTEVTRILKDNFGVDWKTPELPKLGSPILQYLPEAS
jgi:hypothetical protein